MSYWAKEPVITTAPGVEATPLTFACFVMEESIKPQNSHAISDVKLPNIQLN
jgi:hypothetical protein